MAAMLDMSNDRVNFAFTGSRDNIWHGLGNELPKGQPIEVWAKEAGMEWKVESSPASFTANNETFTFPEKRILYRSDTFSPLSVVSDTYNIVQPIEILEFFRDLVGDAGMELTTAGCLMGGRRYWAMAEMGSFEPVKGDTIKGNILLVTSVDSTLATVGKITTTRVVCNNTLTAALNSNEKNVVRVTHRSEFNPSDVKIDLGLIDHQWQEFQNNIVTLQKVKTTDYEAKAIFEMLLFDQSKSPHEQSSIKINQVATLFNFYKNGMGASYSGNTLYGVLNAVTEAGTHGFRRQAVESRFMSSMMGGQLDKLKTDAFNTVMRLAA